MFNVQDSDKCLAAKKAALKLLSQILVFVDTQKKFVASRALIIVALLIVLRIQAVPLIEDGFNYPAGSPLASNSPWAGTPTLLTLVTTNGNLTVTNLNVTTPPGNMVQFGIGPRATAYRNFTASPISQGTVYLSILLNVAVAPTRGHLVAALASSGATASNQPDDPLDLLITASGTGYRVSVTHSGSDPGSASTVLALNTTYLIAAKYDFSTDRVSLYISPTPGAPEPIPSAVTQQSDDGGAFTGNLQVVILSASGDSTQGRYDVDTLRIGTNWSDVTPFLHTVSLSGPSNQNLCAGSPALFTVNATGTPPVTFQWRASGIPIAGATNSTFSIASPAPADALSQYDVIVTDAYSAATSAVASLSLSYSAPQIVSPPANQILWPGVTNTGFSVSATGDAPMTFQWLSNGIPVIGATNTSFNLTNVNAAQASNLFSVVITNPCGSVTSPAASVQFATAFYASEGLPGFFSGMNLITTNIAGVNLFAWSSANPGISVTNWTLEGPMSEQPLNDGSGKSVYSINVNPAAPIVYYVIGQTVSPPYVAPAAVQWINSDASGNLTFSNGSYAITPGGFLVLPGAPPQVAASPVGGGLQVQGLTVPGTSILIQATDSLTPPVNWITIATNTADTNGIVSFQDNVAGSSPGRFYRLVLP